MLINNKQTNISKKKIIMRFSQRTSRVITDSGDDDDEDDYHRDFY